MIAEESNDPSIPTSHATPADPSTHSQSDTHPSHGGLSGASASFGLSADGTSGPDPLIGVTVGDVVIERLIAEGGMGRVYLGWQRQPLRQVAVKFLRAVHSPTALERFRREAELLARLACPGIAAIHSAGSHRVGLDEIPYYVMEYVPDAVTITDYARRERLSVERRVELFLGCCDPLARGHAAGVVHRDIKPGNLLVTPAGKVTVIDFGIAKLTDDGGEGGFTTTGEYLGTRRYMSPEQFEGGRGRIDARCDVYALGVVLQELLTGSLPHDTEGLSLAETASLLHRRSPRPLELPAREAPTALRRGLRRIAANCLALDPAKRYADAGELAEDLRGLLAGRMVRRRAAGGRPPGRRAIAAGVAVLLAAAGWLVGVEFLPGPAQRAWTGQAAGLGPRARFENVSSGRTTPLAHVEVKFDQPMQSLATSDLRLTKDGKPIDTATLELVRGNSRNWRVEGIEKLTDSEGTYTLSLVGTDSGPLSEAGRPLAEPASVSWKMPPYRAWAFTIRDPVWREHVVSMEGVEVYTEQDAGGATFIRPTVKGKPGEIVLRFATDFEIHAASLMAMLAVWTTGDPFPYDPGARALLDISPDGERWTNLITLEANRGGFAGPARDITDLVEGSREVWVRVQLTAEREWPEDGLIHAQFLRSGEEETHTTFDLRLTGPHPPVHPGDD